MVDGVTGGAIYNLLTGDILAIDQDTSSILSLAEKGFQVTKIADLLGVNTTWAREILSVIATRGLGKFYSRKTYLEKYKKGSPVIEEGHESAPIIRKLYIELPGPCDLTCSFCESLKIYPCATCSAPSRMQIDEEALFSFLERILGMQCMAIVFHGGDPVSAHDFFAAVEFCRTLGFDGKIFVVTNGTSINNDVAQFFAHYRIHPVIPFVGEGNSGLMNREALSRVARSLRQKGVGFYLTLVITADNASDVKKLRSFATHLGSIGLLETAVVSDPSSTHVIKALGNQMMRVSVEIFYHNTKYHPCLHGTLGVTADGKLLPCPFLKDEVLGDIAKVDVIEHIFEERLVDHYWRLNLSRIPKCKNCQFRFGCTDCRAAERALTGDLHGKQICAWEICKRKPSRQPFVR